mmetsp:Transcript_12566/g.34681  ORF Transcript_12566/g.34681 Transcript_12566/m.34681 type:complete len:223 (-) Transcript_12566:476-1144(-)
MATWWPGPMEATVHVGCRRQGQQCAAWGSTAGRHSTTSMSGLRQKCERPAADHGAAGPARARCGRPLTRPRNLLLLPPGGAWRSTCPSKKLLVPLKTLLQMQSSAGLVRWTITGDWALSTWPPWGRRKVPAAASEASRAACKSRAARRSRCCAGPDGTGSAAASAAPTVRRPTSRQRPAARCRRRRWHPRGQQLLPLSQAPRRCSRRCSSARGQYRAAPGWP